MSYDSSTTELEREEDAGKGQAGIVARWRQELDAADEAEKEWRKRAAETVDRFRDEEDRSGTFNISDNVDSSFNILWSNVETLSPALYGQTPQPDIRRRFRDPDPVGKVVAEVLERAVSYTLDSFDFDCVMEDAVNDYLLPGRAVTRVRYLPDFDGEDLKSWEKTECEHVDWRDFRRGPGRRWDEVEWIAFRHRLTRKQLVEYFGAKGKRVELDGGTKPDQAESEDDAEKQRIFKTAEVQEIWYRPERKVIFISDGYKNAPLRIQPDPLRLTGFFPCPRPLYGVRSSGSLVPIEGDRHYRAQAEELDRVTRRIRVLVKAVKFGGIYDSRMDKEIQQVFDSVDNEFIPAEQVAALVQDGGLDRAIWTIPIDVIVQVLDRLYLQREQIKQTIYELTGISDILRGATDPDETLGAQQLKAQSGTRRLQRRQREVQRYARDLIRMMAEIIAEHFSPETLMQMTGQKFPPQQARDAARKMLAQQQAAAQQMRPQRMAA